MKTDKNQNYKFDLILEKTFIALFALLLFGTALSFIIIDIIETYSGQMRIFSLILFSMIALLMYIVYLGVYLRNDMEIEYG